MVVGRVLGLLAILTRLPGLVSARMFDVDESYLAAMGLTMGRGGKLYIDTARPETAAAAVALFALGTSAGHGGPANVPLAPRSGRRRGRLRRRAVSCCGSEGVARCGGSRRPAGTRYGGFLPADGQAANFELFASSPRAPRYGSHSSAGTSDGRGAAPSGGGGCPGGGGGHGEAPLFAMVRRSAASSGSGDPSRGRRGGGRRIGVGRGGHGLPFGLGRVWEWAWVQTSDFLDGQVGGWRIVGVLLVVVAVFVAFHLPALAASWRHRSQFRQVDVVVWWWLIGAAVAIIPGFRFIFHYFQLLVPPTAVLAGWLLSKESRRTVRDTVAWASVIAVDARCSPHCRRSTPGESARTSSRAIQQRTGHDDRILVWGAMPEVYWRAERLPAARFLSVG